MPDPESVQNSRMASFSDDRSVSTILSSYYNINEDTTPSNDTHKDVAGYGTNDDTETVTGAGYTSPDFDVDQYVDNFLKKASISDTLSLLRRLEREIRQLTAGKQLLVYDNYECLFSALDTVHNINSELDIVQKHLQILKSSQVKALYKDVTSRYGIRDKLVVISHLSRTANVIRSFLSITKSLSAATLKGEDQGSENISKLCYEKISIASKAYFIISHISRVVDPIHFKILFGESCSNIRSLIETSMVDLLKLLNNDVLDDSMLLSLCNDLYDLGLHTSQIWDIYYKGKSYKIEKLLSEIDFNDDVRYIQLCATLVDPILKYIYDSVSSDGFFKLSQNLNAACPGQPLINSCCIFCCDKAVVSFFNSTCMHSSYYLASDSSCNCSNMNIKNQFVVYYTQVAYSMLSKPIMLNSKDSANVMQGLMYIVDSIGVLNVDDDTQSTFVDISYKWIVLLSFLQLQSLFIRFYDSLIKYLTSNLGDATVDVNAFITTGLKLMLSDDIKQLYVLVKGIQHSLDSNLEDIFHSFVVMYILSIKKIFTTLDKKLSLLGDYTSITSLASLTALRSYKNSNTDEIPSRLDLSGSSINKHELSSLNLDNYLSKTIDEHIKLIKGKSRRDITIQLLIHITQLDRAFEDTKSLLSTNLNGGLDPYDSANLKFSLPKTPSDEFTLLFRKFISNLNTNKIGTKLDDIFSDCILFEEFMCISHYKFEGGKFFFPMKTSDDYTDKRSDPYNGEINIDLYEVSSKIMSRIMVEYLNNGNNIIRNALDSLENGNDIIATSVKDFTVLLSEILEDLNKITLTDAVQYNNELIFTLNEFDDYIRSYFQGNNDIAHCNYTFNLSKDMCIKLFTLKIAQNLGQFKELYIIENNALNKLINGLKRQLSILFKKPSDVNMMQLLWEHFLYT